jgi:hypothetical protein
MEPAPGEPIYKMTILEFEAQRIGHPDKLRNPEDFTAA